MIAYIGRRLAYGLLVLLMVVVFVFVTLRLIPGSAVRAQLGDTPGIDPARIDELTRQLGLDQPILQQFWHFLSNAVTGDLGHSFQSGDSVGSLIAQRLPATLELGALAMAIGLLIGIPLGLLSATRPNSFLDQLLRLVSVAGISIPSFWLALLMISYFARWFGWSVPLTYSGPFEDLGQNLAHVILPAFALAAATVASVARMLRSSMLETMQSNFIRTVRAKGASESRVLLRHASRSSIIPVFTLLGLQAGGILGGTVILEAIFAIPGMGSLIFDAVQHRDYPVVLGCVIVYAGVFILINLVVDVMYGVIDPRIRNARANA